MSVTFLIWWFAISTRISIHISTVGLSSLPRGIYGHAIGYDDTKNLIWLIGGSDSNEQSLISFNLSLWNTNDTNAFIDHKYPLSYLVSSDSQAYVQTEAGVYVVERPGNKLLVYNISAGNVNLIDTNPSYVELAVGGCLASIGDWIIYTHLNDTFILTVSTHSWQLSGNPSMKLQRRYHACIVEPNQGYLYVIGGSVWPLSTDSIAKLYVKNITDIHKYNFSTLTNSLTQDKAYMAAVLYKTDIYVAGGLYEDGIDVINTTTDSVIFWGTLNEQLQYASPIIVGSRLYIFGGKPSDRLNVDYWQYFDLFSMI